MELWAQGKRETPGVRRHQTPQARSFRRPQVSLHGSCELALWNSRGSLSFENVRSRALPDKQPQSGFCRRAVGRRLCVQGQWPRSVQGQGRRCRAPALGRDEGGDSLAKGSALLTNPFSRGDGGRIRNNPLKIKHVVSSANCGTAVGRSFPRPSEPAAGSPTVATPRGQTVCPRPLGPSCALPCPQTTRTMRSPLSL